MNKIRQDTQLKRAYRAYVKVHGKKYYEGDNTEIEAYVSIVE